MGYSANGTHANYAINGTHDHTIPNLNLPEGPIEDYTDNGPLWDPTLSAYYYTYDATTQTFAAYDSRYVLSAASFSVRSDHSPARRSAGCTSWVAGAMRSIRCPILDKAVYLTSAHCANTRLAQLDQKTSSYSERTCVRITETRVSSGRSLDLEAWSRSIGCLYVAWRNVANDQDLDTATSRLQVCFISSHTRPMDRSPTSCVHNAALQMRKSKAVLPWRPIRIGQTVFGLGSMCGNGPMGTALSLVAFAYPCLI